jgi:STE24 endopeptidase
MKLFWILICLVGLSFTDTYASVPDSMVVSTQSNAAFNTDQAINSYLNSLSADQKERSDAYFEGGYWIQLWDLLLAIVTAFIFLFLGLSGWIKRIAQRSKKVVIQNIIYIIFYFVFAYLISFPFGLYTDFFREHQYNLSTMTLGGWFTDEMKGFALSLVFITLIFSLIYLVIRKVKQNWWLWGSGVFIIFCILMVYITPVFISPIFNDFKPLAEGELKSEILSMARANGVPADNVYQFNASKQSTRISANVSGIGNTIRISLNDNLLNKCSKAEIRSVMGHELGHYVLNHVFKLIVYFSILIIIGFAFINWAFHILIRRFGANWGVIGISDIGGLPLIIVLFSIYMFFATPALNNIIRTHEIEADRFGLNAACEPDGAASVAMKLSEYRKINPTHLEEIIFFDHPSGRTRVTNAMIWKAEHINK